MKRPPTTLSSPYYPPRAGVRSRVTLPVQAGWRRFRRLAGCIPTASTIGQEAQALLVPGRVYVLAGWPRLGRTLTALWVMALLVFLSELGRPAADWAFMALLSIHTASVSQRFQAHLAGRRLSTQMLIGMGIFAVVALLVYLPVRRLFETRIVMPLRTSHGLVVVKAHSAAGAIRRDDWLAYRIDARWGGGLVVNEGVGFGPVLALPGDRVEFDERGCRVNGVARPRLPYMPGGGSLTLARNQWLVWPQVRVSIHGVPEDAAAQAMLKIAIVEPEAIIGRPFKRWFFRKQVLP